MANPLVIIPPRGGPLVASTASRSGAPVAEQLNPREHDWAKAAIADRHRGGGSGGGNGGALGDAEGGSRASSPVDLAPKFVRILSPLPLPVVIVGGGLPGAKKEEEPEEKRGRLGRILAGLEGIAKWGVNAAAGLSRLGVNAVGNRGLPVVGQGLDAAARNLPGLLGRTAGMFGTLVTATANLTNAFLERGKELARFSGPLAQAQANARVQGIMADVREAQTLGPNMARLTDSATDIWINIRENVLMPIKKALLEFIVPAVEAVAEIIKDVGPYVKAGIEIIATILKALIDAVTFEWTAARDAIKSLPDKVADAFKSRFSQQKGLFSDILERTINQLPSVNMNTGLPAAPVSAVNAPVFQGI